MDKKFTLMQIRKALNHQEYIVDVLDDGPNPESSQYLLTHFDHPQLDANHISNEIENLYQQGLIGSVSRAEWLAVLYSHPSIADYERALRHIDEYEQRIRTAGAIPTHEQRAQWSASHRHRGVVEHLRGHYEAGLDYFIKALNLSPTALNGHNVLCALTCMEEIETALDAFDLMCTQSPHIAAELDSRSRHDTDLAPLRVALARRISPPDPQFLGSRMEALRTLIATSFTEPELRQWVAQLPNSRAVLDALPGPSASFGTLVYELCETLLRLGWINRALFVELRRVRPKRAQEIQALEAIWWSG